MSVYQKGRIGIIIFHWLIYSQTGKYSVAFNENFFWLKVSHLENQMFPYLVRKSWYDRNFYFYLLTTLQNSFIRRNLDEFFHEMRFRTRSVYSNSIFKHHFTSVLKSDFLDYSLIQKNFSNVDEISLFGKSYLIGDI